MAIMLLSKTNIKKHTKIKNKIKEKNQEKINKRKQEYLKMGKSCYSSYLKNKSFLLNPSIHNYTKVDYLKKKHFLEWIMKYSKAECCWCSNTTENAIYLLSRIYNISYDNILIARIEGLDGITYKRDKDYYKPKNLVCDGGCGGNHYKNREIHFDFHSVLIYSKKKINNIHFNIYNCQVFDINDGSPSMLGVDMRTYLKTCLPYENYVNIKIKKFSESNYETTIQDTVILH